METEFTTGTSFLAIGELKELQSFGVEFKNARGLPGNLPVLTCHIGEKQKHFLGPKIGKGSLGFGYIPLDDGIKLQMIRIQLGDLQFCWIAEMDDPDLWADPPAQRQTSCKNVYLQNGVMFCAGGAESQNER